MLRVWKGRAGATPLPSLGPPPPPGKGTRNDGSSRNCVFRMGGPGAAQIGQWVPYRKPASNPPRVAPQDGGGGVYVEDGGNGRDAARPVRRQPLGVRSLNTSDGEAAPCRGEQQGLRSRLSGGPIE